ncbi:unnamed protein product [Rotaria magnacalcarata]
MNLDYTPDMFNQALIIIESKVLEMGGKELEKLELPTPQRNSGDRLNSTMLRETSYDVKELDAYITANEPLLVPDQRAAHNAILTQIEKKTGGTGKTFVINLLLAKIRHQSKIAIAVASSGIAATLLHGGRTAHSTLKLPLKFLENQTHLCSITKGTGEAKVLQECEFIVWDECIMAHRYALEALNYTLQDLRNNGKNMGGVIVLIAGDFRQTLPVIPKVEELKSKVFPNIQTHYKDHKWLCERAILTPKNVNINAININLQIQQQLPSEAISYKSIDTVKDIDMAIQYPTEFLNSLEPSGMPPHNLRLKIGSSIMLLRNLDAPRLCNGTRLCVKTLMPHVIEARIMTGCAKDRAKMPSYPSPIPAPIFDSDESDGISQHSDDSSSYLSSQFKQYTRLSFSPKLNCNSTSQILPLTSTLSFDDDNALDGQDNTIDIESTPTKLMNSTSRKRKRTNDNSQHLTCQTPNQSPYTRRKNLDYVQQITFQSPKVQRRTRNFNQSAVDNPPVTFSTLININPFKNKHHYHTRLVAKRESLLIPSLKNLFIQRYEQEFHYESCLGYGEFSQVNLCTNRLDGLNYAIKTSKQSLIGTCHEQEAWREICAYAALTTHENLIRYYSSWIESDGRFFIQLEHCNGGSLEDLIEKNRKDNKFLNEDVLKTILHQMSNVLSFMHRSDLAHIDIKPSNIMLCYYTDNDVTYKLADLGHVSQISSCTVDNDGDCRYLALEIIQKSNSTSLYLDKCDIYSLGLTLYVCATNYIMPKKGNEWEQLRLNITQFLQRISQCSKQFNELLLERMCNIDPNRRPSAYELLLDPLAQPAIPTSVECLRHTLKQERTKNLLLNKKLLDQYILTNTSDLQTLPLYSTDINNSGIRSNSPTQSILVPQYQYTLTPTNNSRVILVNSPGFSTNLNQSVTSPVSCSTLAMKQQAKLAGSVMFRYYSSII